MAELTQTFSSVSLESCDFEVFLNFRSKDTRNNFIGFLHKALEDSGIIVFIDSEELWAEESISPALVKVIENSKISIPVFSKDYASSKGCLEELLQIVHYHRSNGQIVLPIFFDVERSDVRDQSGSFEGSFREHEKNFEPQVLESWKEALRMVGNLEGWVLEEDVNGNQAKLVELVVKRVLSEVIKNTLSV
ncbi:hypothetical protein NE237_000466 [Protea cynaroides]|uniref:ADP-ribosyl cyclase/cyclic ADP-ribose hydrolase n=1 Tax=Protea cynaroides TaxID=273540 RepID=A0A9Q0QXI1_9MAGN|nr:hypothetical protein NE237_000466 [Protea cynaroides]